ncbi:PIG-L deacetylase family protein [Myxococcus sp. AM010]|uniref:PIG-L deacetylase family protein n=1 Tax=Myxococcus sp. AM010 TaxID=2745138 RepID=UPI001595A854|nr:PIG-L family deacetylase [Myxococcus sp. AM010]NVJ16161.1 PIG-L family deacetylase [Myxococcus sp. AM010]
MSEWPVIFYIPHPDDEAIGMAGGIREHVEAGRPVYLVLITDGHNSCLRAMLNSEPMVPGSSECDFSASVANCPLYNPSNPSAHPAHHNHDMSEEDIGLMRRVELLNSARVLGVKDVFIEDTGKGFSDAAVATSPLMVADIIKKFEARFPGASHKVPSGAHDIILDANGNCTTPNGAHKAIWDGAVLVKAEGLITDFKGYRIYHHLSPNPCNTTPAETVDISPWFSFKRASIDQYRLWDPDSGRFALGQHSLQPSGMLDDAYLSQFEYRDPLP